RDKLVTEFRRVLFRSTFVRGDALEPRGPGNHLVVQVVNDRSLQWGGGGFATAVRRRFPAAHDAFQKWAQGSPDRLQLAAVHFARSEERRVGKEWKCGW